MTAKATSVASLAAVPTNYYANLAQVETPLSGSNVYATGSIAFDLDGSGKQTEDMVNLRTITIMDRMNTVAKKMEVVISFKDMGPRMPEKIPVAAATVA